MTDDELTAHVHATCRRSGVPHLADEISTTVDGTYGVVIARPRRALTEREAWAMLRVWQDGYKAAGKPTCPHPEHLDCPCPEGSVPDLDNEERIADWLARLLRGSAA